MVRLSDILKKDLPPSQEPPGRTSSSGSAGQKASPIPQGRHQQQKPDEMQIVRAMKEAQPDIEHSREFYNKGIGLMEGLEEVLAQVDEHKPVEINLIRGFIERIVNYLVLGDQTYLTLFYEDYPVEKYPYRHMVNVLIASIRLGLGLKYNKSRLNALGLAAFLHDNGMFKLKQLTNKPGVLSKQEYEQVKQHPIKSATILSLIEGIDISGEIKLAIQEHHERADGSGYPDGRCNTEISQYSQIIAVADVYEALTHKRSYRKKYSPHEALRNLLSLSSSSFDKNILKVLVNQFGIYSINSWVSLNSNEIAKVTALNSDWPLRPAVTIIFNAAKERLEKPRLVNLAEHPNVHIKAPLADEEVSRLREKPEA